MIFNSKCIGNICWLGSLPGPDGGTQSTPKLLSWMWGRKPSRKGHKREERKGMTKAEGMKEEEGK